MTRLGILCSLVMLATSGLASVDPCPEHCECRHGLGAGASVRCYQITPLQRFQDPVTSFSVERNQHDPSPALDIPSKFFIDLGPGMQFVDSISIDVDIASIDRDAFQGLTGLTYLNLTNNNLKYIHPDTFANNSHLRQLTLSKNPLAFEGVFLNSPDLRELDLSSCQLYNLTPNAFEKLSELVYINLDSNYLVDINPKTFEGLTFLEEVRLSNNNIRTLTPDAFLKNEVLNVLILNHNPLDSVEGLKLPSLTHLDLKHCGFTKLTSSSFDGFTEIKTLNLTGNSITELSPDTFSKLSHLLYLDISNNKLGALDERMFVENRELETLSLRDNPSMKVWPEKGFQGQLQDLYRLDISNTGIQTLGVSSLRNMSSLAQLDLSNNQLRGLDVGVLPRKVKFLSLAFNNITSLNDINFPKEFQVRHLFLQGNQIKYLNLSNFENLPYLARLDLSSCGLESIWHEEHIEIDYIRLRQLNLSKNKLQTILPKDLKVFSQLEMLDIRRNPLKCNEDLLALLGYLRDSPIDPIASSSVGNIDANFETFLWEDIWTQNCQGLPNLPQPPNKSNYVKQTVPPLKIHTVTIDQREPISSDDGDYEDVIDIDTSDPDYEQYDYDTSKTPYRKASDVPELVHESDTSPLLIVFLSALVMTLVVTLLLALVATLCKHKLLSHERSIRKPGHRSGSLSYKPLHESEHHNLPTTPIVRVKSDSATLDGDVGMGTKAGTGTHFGRDFQHSRSTPDMV